MYHKIIHIKTDSRVNVENTDFCLRICAYNGRRGKRAFAEFSARCNKMKKLQNKTFFKLLFNLVSAEKDSKIVALIDNSNMEILHAIAVAATAVQVLSLVVFIVFKMPSSPKKLSGVLSVLFCIAVVALIALLTKKLSDGYKKTGDISHIKTTALVIGFYTVLSIWGIWVDVNHYRLGEQMLTFYIVQFCFLSFLMIVPKIGSFLILAMYILLFIPTVLIDDAKFIQPNNHFAFAAIAVFANAIQYSRAVEKNKDKIGISELNRTLRERSMTDDLTRLKNRYALREEFEMFIGKNILITMADIDYFKSVNDTYGHLVGDELLRLVAKSLVRVFDGAEIYRYGGDEFLIILQDCTQEEYAEKLTAWNEAVAKIKIADIEQQFACSSGYSVGTPSSVADYRALLKEADDKLYAVKKVRKGA